MRLTYRQSGPYEASNSNFRFVHSLTAFAMGVSGVLGLALGCSSPAVRTVGGSATPGTSGGSGTGGASQTNNATGGAPTGTGATGGKSGTPSGGAPNVGVGSGGTPATGSGGGSTVVNTGWWDAAWAKRRVITVQGPQAEALVNFPVPVKLGADFDFASAKSMGEDIRFTDASGTLLDSEIETWSATEAIIWVRVPSLPPMGQSVELRMYYGNSAESALPATGSQGVWSTDSYIGVWHFQDGKDSGAGKFDGAPWTGVDPGMMNGAGVEFLPAKVGKGVQFHQDMRGHIDLAKAAPLLGGVSTISFSGWLQLHPSTADWSSVLIAIGGNQAIGGVPGGHAAFQVAVDGETLINETNPLYVGAGYYELKPPGVKVPLDIWTHLVVVADVPTRTTAFYQDGIKVDTMTAADYKTAKFPDGLPSDGSFFGCNATVHGDFAQATMDEFRLQKVNRSAEWIKAEYASMTSPTFAMVGALETH